MPATIRTFRNTDAEAICRVWNEHYAEQGVDAHLLPLALELGCLAKPFFEPNDLVIAEVDDTVVGFMHMAKVAGGDGVGDANEVAGFDFFASRDPLVADPLVTDSEASVAESTLLKVQQATPVPQSLAIVALCVSPLVVSDSQLGFQGTDADIAAQLLKYGEQTAIEFSLDQLRFKPMLPNGGFYLGYGPADSMIGTTSNEQRTCEWLRGAGFEPARPTNLWELDLSRCQAPVVRMQLQIRRTAHVDRQVDEPLLPWWQACVLGHTEAAAFQLTDRLEKRVLLEILYWTVAPELQLSPHSVAWLWPPELPPSEPGGGNARTPSLSDKMVFLLGESLRELQGESIDLVRTVSTADHPAMSQLLRRLGFKPLQSGMVFHKRLAATVSRQT